MKEYLVEGHLGGYYTSFSEPEDIERYCEECGDYDHIIASWDDEIDRDKYKTLLNYIITSYFTSKDDIESYLISF